MQSNFKTLPALLDYFKDEQKCIDFLTLQRWGGTVACPHCGNAKVYITNRGYKCAEKTCHKKFSVTSGTIFENTKISLRIWFGAMYMLSTAKKGISSCQLERQLGVTQKTAWFLLHRVRQMLNDKAPQLLDNIVEVDEVVIGGKIGNIHKYKKEGKPRDFNKSYVFGAVERGGKVALKIVPSTGGVILKPVMRELIHKDAVMFSDSSSAYMGLHKEFNGHAVVNHDSKEYVRGVIHTNTIEGFWSLLKRGIVGVYHYVSPKHLHRYCDEFGYRYNNRKFTTNELFETAFQNIEGNRLTYAGLIK